MNLSSLESVSTCHFSNNSNSSSSGAGGGGGTGGGGGGGYNGASLSSSSYSSSSIINTIDTLSTTSSSSSSIPSSSNTTTASPLQSSSNSLTTAKDWFTYVYKIDNIEDIIRSHEVQQNFIQSPIFQFKNHFINSTKQNSNWRLIFYPNGAGQDCKNFLSIFLKYLSDEPVKIQMMFSIVNNNNEDVYVKYTVNKFNKTNDWGFKQLIHKNAILFQQDKFLKQGALSIRVKMRLEEHKNEYVKKLNDNLHYCKILSENFSQYYYQNNNNNSSNNNQNDDYETNSYTSSSLTTSTNTSYYDILLIVKNSIVNTNNCHNIEPIHDKTNLRRKSSDNTNLAYPPSKRLNTSNYYNQTSDNNENILVETNNDDDYLIDTSNNNSNKIQTTTSSSYSSSSSNNDFSNSNSNKKFYRMNNNTQSTISTTATTTTTTTTTQATSQIVSQCLYCNNSGLNKIKIETSSSALASSSTVINDLNNNNNNNLNFNNSMNNSNNNMNNTNNKLNNLNNCCDYLNQQQQQQQQNSHNLGNNMQSASLQSNNLNMQPQTITEIYEFKAHKCILAARSPVFKAMFNYRLKENLTNKVIIEDCKPDVIKAMLKYIYTAYLPDDINSIAIDLFIAAEKYYIDSLKLKVREYLVEHLNIDNVLQTYILSELYNDSMLRKQSLKFITENIDEVTQHSDWDEYIKIYPQFFTNAFKRLCKKNF